MAEQGAIDLNSTLRVRHYTIQHSIQGHIANNWCHAYRSQNSVVKLKRHTLAHRLDNLA